MMSWHLELDGQERLALETRLVALDFPQMQVVICDDGKVRVAGYLQPKFSHRAYYVVLEYPDYYPFDRIKVYCPETDFVVGTPHRFSDDSLCVEHGDFAPDDTVCTVLGWTAQWLTLYEHFLQTEETW
jgi:hypothetical protein